MKNLIFGLFTALWVSLCFGATPKLDSKLGTEIAACPKTSSQKKVWIFKQWHLAPGIVGKGDEPQLENQTAIFKQLDAWVKAENIADIYAEGCEGELTESSPIKINGETIASLKAKASLPSFDQVISSVPMKLEARYGSKVNTQCADNLNLLKEHGLAFSDARGTVGFLTRINQHKNDPGRVKLYLDGVIDLYKLPKSTSPEQAIVRLKNELKSAILRINVALEKRNDAIVEKLKDLPSKESALIVGGLHAKGISTRLEKLGINCSIVEPKGYQDREEELTKSLESLAGGL